MIVLPMPPLPAAEAARRVARGRDPFWLCGPGQGEVEVSEELVGCDPARTVRGGSVDALQEAWTIERRLWGAERPRTPIGVGALCYDLGRQFERLPVRAVDEHGWPDIVFGFYDAVWVRQTEDETCAVLARSDEAARRLRDRLSTPVSAGAAPTIGPLRPDEADDRYLEAVARILSYIRAGDAYQVNLARRLTATVSDGDPVWIADRLRREAPAPHALWLLVDGGRASLVGNSPERFLRVGVDGDIETRPIKGTRARAADLTADAAAAAQLASSEKDRAEHVMIVDLERNDLGRICQPRSVAVVDLARPLRLPTVHHLVSTVKGRLREGVGLAAILRATFPGGSITGAPKIRAMEIIEELEPVRRGPYTGATGWLGAAGDLDLAVAIRTAAIRDGKLRLWVGGGIVADSRPEDELQETQVKAAAFARLCGDRSG